MAENDILLRKKDTIKYESSDELIKYSDWEDWDGVVQYFNPGDVVYYNDNATSFHSTNPYLPYYGITDTSSCALIEYTTSTGSTHITPKANQLISKKYYLHKTSNNRTLYVYPITLYLVESGAGGGWPIIDTYTNRNSSFYYIGYKIQCYFGWNSMHNNDGTLLHYNPMTAVNSLSDVSNSINGYDGNTYGNPYYKLDSYAFAELFFRRFRGGDVPKWNQYFKTYYIKNGIKYTQINGGYNIAEPGWPTESLSESQTFLIPGNPYDQTDQHYYCIYGYIATNCKLAQSNKGTCTAKLCFGIGPVNSLPPLKIPITYIGCDNRYSSHPGTASGFLNSNSGSLDYGDSLMYIYKFFYLLNKPYTIIENDYYFLTCIGIDNGVYKIRIPYHLYISSGYHNCTMYAHVKFTISLYLNRSLIGSETIEKSFQAEAGGSGGIDGYIDTWNNYNFSPGNTLAEVRVTDLQTYFGQSSSGTMQNLSCSPSSMGINILDQTVTNLIGYAGIVCNIGWTWSGSQTGRFDYSYDLNH